MKLHLEYKMGVFATDEEVTGIQYGEIVEATIKKKRNLKFHKKFFALRNMAADILGYQRDHLLTDLKIRVGHYDDYITEDGKLVYIPRSINFETMDDLEFHKFYQECRGVLDKLISEKKGKHFTDWLAASS